MKYSNLVDYSIPLTEEQLNTKMYFTVDDLENIIFKTKNNEYTIDFKKFLKDYGVKNE